MNNNYSNFYLQTETSFNKPAQAKSIQKDANK